MEGHLDHKIAEIIQKNDGLSTFQNKGELWQQINAARHPKRVVPFIWKIAAILFAFFLFSGVFAGIFNRAKTNREKENLELANKFLQVKIDSLLELGPKVVKEIEVVEKERVVYVKETVREAGANTIEATNSQALNELKTSLEEIIEQYKQDVDALKQQVAQLENEKAIALKNKQAQDSANNRPPFVLKAELTDEQMKNNIKVETPKIELKLFNNAMKNSKIDANTSIMNNR